MKKFLILVFTVLFLFMALAVNVSAQTVEEAESWRAVAKSFDQGADLSDVVQRAHEEIDLRERHDLHDHHEVDNLEVTVETEDGHVVCDVSVDSGKEQYRVALDPNTGEILLAEVEVDGKRIVYDGESDPHGFYSKLDEEQRRKLVELLLAKSNMAGDVLEHVQAAGLQELLQEDRVIYDLVIDHEGVHYKVNGETKTYRHPMDRGLDREMLQPPFVTDDDKTDKAEDNADKAADRAEDNADKAADKAEDKADKAADKTDDEVDKAEDKADDQADRVAEKTGDAADKTTDEVEDRIDRALDFYLNFGFDLGFAGDEDFDLSAWFEQEGILPDAEILKNIEKRTKERLEKTLSRMKALREEALHDMWKHIETAIPEAADFDMKIEKQGDSDVYVIEFTVNGRHYLVKHNLKTGEIIEWKVDPPVTKPGDTMIPVPNDNKHPHAHDVQERIKHRNDRIRQCLEEMGKRRLVRRYEAIRAALDHFEISHQDAQNIRVRIKRDDGNIFYNIQFDSAGTHYEATVDRHTGAILESEIE